MSFTFGAVEIDISEGNVEEGFFIGGDGWGDDSFAFEEVGYSALDFELSC